MTNYDKKMWKQGFPECPWLSIVLHMAVLTPFLVIFIFLTTICIVLCVYLKEHFKGFKRLFSSNQYPNREIRPDKDYENQILKEKFAREGPDHIELQEELGDEDEELQEQQYILEHQVEQEKLHVHAVGG